MVWFCFMKKDSYIFEELMYVNKKEEEQKLKNTDIKLSYNAWKIKKVFRIIASALELEK